MYGLFYMKGFIRFEYLVKFKLERNIMLLLNL